MYNPYIPSEYWIDYKVSFYSGLMSGIISGIITGIIVGIVVWQLQRHHDNKDLDQRAHQDYSVFLQSLKHKLSLHDVVRISCKLSNWLPHNIIESIKYITDNPIDYWSSNIKEGSIQGLKNIMKSYNKFLTVSSHLDIATELYLTSEETITPYEIAEVKEIMFALMLPSDPDNIISWSTKARTASDLEMYKEMFNRLTDELGKTITDFQEAHSTLLDKFEDFSSKIE